MLETRITKTVRLSGRVSAKISYVASTGLSVEWYPSVPAQLGDAEMHNYRAARDEILAEVALRTRLRVAVVDAL